MSKHKPILVALFTLVAALGAGTAFAAVRTGVKVVGIRAYADGNTHLYFNAPISSTCGSIIRVGGAGRPEVVRIAIAAQLAGKAVDVETSDVRNGNYCDLSYIKLSE